MKNLVVVMKNLMLMCSVGVYVDRGCDWRGRSLARREADGSKKSSKQVKIETQNEDYMCSQLE